MIPKLAFRGHVRYSLENSCYSLIASSTSCNSIDNFSMYLHAVSTGGATSLGRDTPLCLKEHGNLKKILSPSR